MLVPNKVEDGSSIVIQCATASARFSSWARARRRRARLSREPPIEGKRVGRACASSTTETCDMALHLPQVVQPFGEQQSACIFFCYDAVRPTSLSLGKSLGLIDVAFITL